MAELYRENAGVTEVRSLGEVVSWPAIFAGTFVFVAIELTFGVLGTAIFAPGGVWSGGAGVWLIVLSIISMYFGARAAAHLARSPNSLNGLYHGLATFGVSAFTAIVIAALALMTSFGGRAGTLAQAQGGPATIFQGAQTAGWWLFGALCGAFIAAMIGGSSGVRKPLAPVSQVPTQRAA
jgi:hypothetical protein